MSIFLTGLIVGSIISAFIYSLVHSDYGKVEFYYIICMIILLSCVSLTFYNIGIGITKMEIKENQKSELTTQETEVQ
jgi:Na+/melibiose symporter-like transporter